MQLRLCMAGVCLAETYLCSRYRYHLPIIVRPTLLAAGMQLLFALNKRAVQPWMRLRVEFVVT